MPHVLPCARGGAQHGGRPWGPFQPIQTTLGLSSPACPVPVQSIPGRSSPNWHCRSGSRGQSVPNTAPHSLSHFRPFGSLHREGPRSKTPRHGTCEGEMGKDRGDTMRRQKTNTRLGMQRDRYPDAGRPLLLEIMGIGCTMVVARGSHWPEMDACKNTGPEVEGRSSTTFTGRQLSPSSSPSAGAAAAAAAAARQWLRPRRMQLHTCWACNARHVESHSLDMPYAAPRLCDGGIL
ncbi:hypothetical protein LY76DRAFT_251409 [Colletotrichum caudatum]|nr:hypothetical protein LY76DRAFT_251409 [Colletotrichum caudatum]